MYPSLTIACVTQVLSIASLNFTDTYSIEAHNLMIKVTLADGTVTEDVIPVPAKTEGTDIRNLVWSALDDMPGVKAVKTDGNRLTVWGARKQLKSIEFSAPKDSDGSDPGIEKLSYGRLPTSDVGPKVYVNGKEAPKK